ncbi:two-component system activity regulator YycH [Bacillus sp. DX4.1]|uniref:YycH family regulatory protein n=1 Tax=Bacillus sp. DX4.1 TaxID=3055867 RepID=UPI0025A08388|nr:two-component system activity regulator YycH [Bacillus sp. DX4.1]MDM5191085.1 two-component system activity regulator YycH [Bacillus sp. DX4.1]
MNMENFKTIVLINLVVISLFLTFNLWTYVPESNPLQSTKFVQGNTTATKQDVSNVIVPSSMIIHKDSKENKHFASEKKELIDLLYTILERGEFHDFKDISGSIPKSEFLSYVHGDGKMEIIFPTEIPFDTIRGVLTIKDKKLEKYTFDRIVVDPSRSRDQNIDVNFVSYSNRKIYKMTLTGVALRDLINAQNQFSELARPYFAYDINDMKKIFLPDGQIEMQAKFYMTTDIGVDSFKNALFRDPRYVKRIPGETEDTYTDGIRLMQVNKHSPVLEYTNSSVADGGHMYGSLLVDRSFEFINSHSGLTDDYHFDYMDSTGETQFRLYVGDLPVFNKEGLSTLTQVWGAEDLISYKRPLFKLLTNKGDDKPTSLPSGWVVIQSLEKNPSINKKLIQDIRFGYKLLPVTGINGNVAAVNLKPIWYVVYGENHLVYEWSEEKEGELIGLEQD